MLKNLNDLSENIVIQTFESVDECTDFYYTELDKAKSMKDKEVLTKKEFKELKKHFMAQLRGNIKLSTKKDKVQRKTEKAEIKAVQPQLKKKYIEVSTNVVDGTLPPTKTEQLPPSKVQELPQAANTPLLEGQIEIDTKENLNEKES